LAALGAVCAAAVVFAPSAQAATSKACAPVLNPYPNTRYAGVALSHIRATGVSCATARSVARGAHPRALGHANSPMDSTASPGTDGASSVTCVQHQTATSPPVAAGA
jgi:hypothetical protein